MAPDQHFITVKGDRPEFGLLILPEPGVQPFSQGHIMGCNKNALLLLPQGFSKLIGDLLACLAVERSTLELPTLGITPTGHLRHPAPVLAFGDGPFVVSSFLGHRALFPFL